MADSVRERICAQIAQRLTADRGYKRPKPPYRFMTTGEDFQGEHTPYGANEARFQITIEQGEARPSASNDPLADALAAEKRGHEMLASIITDMGTGNVEDGTGELCRPPQYTDGGVSILEPEHDVIEVVAVFLIVYHWTRGDPETPALPV